MQCATAVVAAQVQITGKEKPTKTPIARFVPDAAKLFVELRRPDAVDVALRDSQFGLLWSMAAGRPANPKQPSELRAALTEFLAPNPAINIDELMKAELGLDIEAVTQLPQAVKGMDIVVTSGPILKHPTPAIEAGWLAPGAFASLVDFDSYWQGAALKEMDKISTDDLAQMGYYRGEGYFKETPEAYADLGEIAAGKKPGRENPSERIAAINLGLALDDMATAIRIYKRAKEMGIGTELPL